ncbi:M23 family metallopeptidase [Sphingopyxis fribergensis]
MTDWSAPEPEPALAPPREVAARAAMPRLSSHYGYRADPIHGTGRMHYGLDIPGPLGTPVLASSGGLVAFAGSAGSYGQMVEIDHGGGLSTRYAHLSRLLVRPGERVGQLEAIALMGSTGRSTGSHLHFEVRVNGRATDPTPLLGQPAALSAVRLAAVDTMPHVSDFARRRAAAPDDGIEGAR